MRILDQQMFCLKASLFSERGPQEGCMLGQAEQEPDFRGSGEEENLIKIVHKDFVPIDPWEQGVQVII